MRTIHVVLAAAVVLGAAMTIRTQGEQVVVQGLPEYGVTLSGTPENPVVENHSGRVVIGYDIKSTDVNGRGLLYQPDTGAFRAAGRDS